MPDINFKTVPTDVPLSVENIDRLAARAAELARAFAARIANIQQQFSDARERYSREADELVRDTEPANRAVAKQFGLGGAAVGVAVIAALSLVTMLIFWATPLISRLLGRIGLTIVVRVLGLILCALAVQFILAGIAESTAGVILREAAAPYAK